MRSRNVLWMGLAVASVWVPPILALSLGAAAARAVGAPRWCGAAARWLLALSIVASGFGVRAEALLQVGADGLVVTTATLMLTFSVGLALGRVLRVPFDTALLVTCGTAICGGSAIAAIAPVLRARPHDVAASLGVVFTLNALALLLFPFVGSALELTGHQFGVWCALAIHDTSSVVGAAATHGQEALEVATITKLVRALWIVPVGIAIAWSRPGTIPGARRVPVPGFLLGFLGAVAAVWAFPALLPLGDGIAELARPGMSLALFCVGLGLDMRVMRGSGARTLVFGGVLWAGLVAACLPIAAAL